MKVFIEVSIVVLYLLIGIGCTASWDDEDSIITILFWPLLIVLSIIVTMGQATCNSCKNGWSTLKELLKRRKKNEKN